MAPSGSYGRLPAVTVSDSGALVSAPSTRTSSASRQDDLWQSLRGPSGSWLRPDPLREESAEVGSPSKGPASHAGHTSSISPKGYEEVRAQLPALTRRDRTAEAARRASKWTRRRPLLPEVYHRLYDLWGRHDVAAKPRRASGPRAVQVAARGATTHGELRHHRGAAHRKGVPATSRFTAPRRQQRSSSCSDGPPATAPAGAIDHDVAARWRRRPLPMTAIQDACAAGYLICTSTRPANPIPRRASRIRFGAVPSSVR